ncbi:hypothetical protein F7C95_11230 [Opitutia bacterium ISCC 51]|nr:hypothetical protein F7C95_11230 [Opitutae bacterium ISCC 51]QXD26604.1 hypothetical protein GA003_11165 [Opitutae bacterium ISCC 52]
MKIIKGFVRAATLLSLSLNFNVSHAAREDLPTLFDEDTLLYLEIPSIPQLKEDWEANPLYELYQREEVKALVDQTIANLSSDTFPKNEENEWDEQDQEMMEGLFTGQLAIGVSNLDFLSFFPDPTLSLEDNQSRGKPIPNFWVVFDYDDESLFDLLVQSLEDDENEYREYEDFYFVLDQEFIILFNEDIAAMCKDEESAIKFIERYLGNDSQPTLADNETFQNGFSRMYENSEIFYFADLSVISEVAEAAAEQYGEMSNAMVQSGQIAPNDIILDALGLDALQGLSGSIDLDPSELRTRSFFHYEENDGFFGKLLGHYGHSLPDANFLSDDLRQVSVSSFDISGMLHDLEETVVTISPMAGQIYLGQKRQIEQTLSIQINEALIDNFSGSLYVAAGETPNTSAQGIAEILPGMESYFDQGNTIILGINDRLSFEALVDALLGNFDRMGMIGKQDYLGISNYAMKTPEPTPGPSIFISDQHIFFEQTNPDFAKLVVASMQDNTNPIFERQDVQDALNELPHDPMSLVYNDAEKFMEFMTKLFKGFGSAIPDRTPEEEEDNPLANLEIPVIDDFEYFTLATGYKEEEGLHQEIIMRPKSN